MFVILQHVPPCASPKCKPDLVSRVENEAIAIIRERCVHEHLWKLCIGSRDDGLEWSHDVLFNHLDYLSGRCLGIMLLRWIELGFEL